MSDERGLLKTCDRCGRQVFLKYIGENVTDGGYTRWDKFEDAPTGWNIVKGVGCVCPECWKEYTELIDLYKQQRASITEKEKSL